MKTFPDGSKSIANGMSRAILADMRKRVKKEKKGILKLAGDAAEESVMRSPAVISLLSNDPEGLRSVFGLTQQRAARFISTVVEEVKRGLILDVSEPNARGDTVCVLEAQSIIIDRIAASKDAEYVSNPSGSTIYFGHWLLQRGDEAIVTGWSVDSQGRLKGSRSGLSVMTKDGGSFSVPPEFSGRPDDNFVVDLLNDPKFVEQCEQILLSVLL